MLGAIADLGLVAPYDGIIGGFGACQVDVGNLRVLTQEGALRPSPIHDLEVARVHQRQECLPEFRPCCYEQI